MTQGARPSLVDLAAVILTASLLFAAGANAAPSLANSPQSQGQVCPLIKASPKLMSLPRMVSPAQFCPAPSGRDTPKALKNCLENYLQNPESFRKQLLACSTAPSPEREFTAPEDSPTIPRKCFISYPAPRASKV